METSNRIAWRRALSVASAVVGLAVAAQPAPVRAADDYPSHPLVMIVPFPPGGAADIVARPVAESMARALKQPVIVENRAGAGGGVGMSQVAKSRPDGYTLLMALSSIVVLPEADTVLQRPAMYKLAQLKPIARFTADPVVLAVKADSPWTSFDQFQAAVKARPGRITYGSSGNYGTMHVPMAQLAVATRTSMLHVPYTGAAPAVVALLGGQVDALATGPSTVAAHVQAGKLRVLAQWGEQRLASMPDVPTLKELGVPISYAQWSGLFVPSDMPAAIVAQLRDAAAAAAADPAVARALQSAGTELQFLASPQFDAYVQQDAATMAKVVQAIGKVD